MTLSDFVVVGRFVKCREFQEEIGRVIVETDPQISENVTENALKEGQFNNRVVDIVQN